MLEIWIRFGRVQSGGDEWKTRQPMFGGHTVVDGSSDVHGMMTY